MKQRAKRFIKSIAKRIGIGITSYDSLQRLEANSNAADDLLFLKALDQNSVGAAIRLLDKSKSQIRQDIFVLAELSFKREGFFVEFGATNGIDLSNTYLLEQEFGWKGILAEPARVWHQDLRKNRISSVDFECVWKETGQTVKFDEVEIAEFSTISEFSSKDMHSELRKKCNSYAVNTVSLVDLLRRHDAPLSIDYLSIDTEGSEYEILRNFDFDTYKISVITCEHNFTSDRQKIYALLTSKGYRRKHENFSYFDDWYVLDG